MKKFIVTVSTAALITAALAGTVSAADNSFTDINGSYAKDAIIELQSMGILEGIDATHFAPKDSLTRAQFVTIIIRALGIDANATTSQFSDVKGWATPFVEAAANAGIIQGVGNGMFSPNATLTREEAATILVRALNLSGELGEADTLTFTDAAQISEWARPYIALAVKYGLVQGNPDGTFNPKGTANREMAATMCVNLLGALDDVEPVTPPVVNPPVVTPPVVTPPVVYYPPYTPPTTTEPPVVTPPVVEPPVVTPPVVEPPVVEPPADEVDVTIPVIALNGESVVDVVYGADYVDAGATATDNKDGDIAGNIVVTITNATEETITAIDTTVAGAYTVHYNVSDAAGNAAVEVTRTVNVAAEVVTPPVSAPVVIRDVYIKSDTVVDSVYSASVGDKVTLTFTTDEGVFQLSNFKIGGNNPDSFASVQNGDVWTNTATYTIQDSDRNGPLTFQINVKNGAGIYSMTTEATTDGSSVVVVNPVPVITDAKIDHQGDAAHNQEVLKFKVSKPIDLGSDKGNLSIHFLDVNGKEINRANGTPLVKDKTWSGYLNQFDADGVTLVEKYGGEGYENVLPAGTELSTIVDPRYGDAWFDAIATVQIVATDSAGQSVTEEIAMPKDRFVTTEDFGKLEGGYNIGFKLNLDNLPYDSIASVTATVYAGDEAIGKATANTASRIAAYAADDEEYGGTDGQLSFGLYDEATLKDAADSGVINEDSDGVYRSSHLEYTQPIVDGAEATSATLAIVLKNGAVITVNYTYPQ